MTTCPNSTVRNSARAAKACGCKPKLPAEYARTGVLHWFATVLPAFIATLLPTKLSRFLRLWQLFNSRVDGSGGARLPTDGPFILAVNHVHGAGSAVTLIAAVLAAIRDSRPDAVDDLQVLVGTRETAPDASRLKRFARSAWSWAKGRWSRNIVQIPMAQEKMSTRMLLEWRKVASKKPSFVFPEGIARPLFGPVREGSGVWLSSIAVPTYPVAVWWHNGEWHVRIGKAISWSEKRELHDLQLGLEIAKLVPEAIVDRGWKNLLGRSKRIRQQEQPAAGVSAELCAAASN